MRITGYLRLIKSLIFRNRLLYAHFALTHHCNLRCKMCNIWESENRGEDISLSKIGELADALKKLRVINIGLGGGEPFSREDLPEVVSIFIKKGFTVRILTNGVAPTETSIKKVVARGARDISVSLDTLHPEKQSYICNYKDAWKKKVENMHLFSEIMPKRRTMLLMNTVVSHFNIEELPQLVQFAYNLGYYISFIPIDIGQLNNPISYRCEFNLSLNDHPLIDKTYNTLITMKRKHSNIFNSTLFLEHSRNYLKTGLIDWQCDAGSLYLSIDPRGLFSICHKFESISSLLPDQLLSRVGTKEFEAERKKLIKDCEGCMRPCWAEVSHLIRDRKSFWEMAKIKVFNFREKGIAGLQW